MSKLSTKYLLISLVIVFLGVSAYLVFSDSEGNDQQEQSQQNSGQAQKTEETDKVANTKGTISGSFTYPSSNIPTDLLACAENAQTDTEVVCSNEQIVDVDRFIYEKGYELEVEAGEYYVYAKTAQGNKAYFIEYVSEVSTESAWPDYGTTKCADEDKKSLVKISANSKITDVTIGDWYFDSTCKPAQ